MATTFQISNGDVVVNKITGQPTLIGNPVGQSDISQAKLKRSQDLQGSLSLNDLLNGASANLDDLRGQTPQLGSDTVAVLMHDQITSMFANILTLQGQRQGIRPDSELFDSITSLIILPLDDDVSYQFSLAVVTVDGKKTTVSGVFSS